MAVPPAAAPSSLSIVSFQRGSGPQQAAAAAFAARADGQSRQASGPHNAHSVIKLQMLLDPKPLRCSPR